jgi:hypothetical protein
MTPRHREEVLNTMLASRMAMRGMDADPETILARGRIKPDVMVRLRGLRCAIEGKVADVADAENIVRGDARNRLDQGIAHLAVAVVYPKHLRTATISRLPNELDDAQFRFLVLTDGGDGSWHRGGIDEILNELRRAHDIVVRDDVLQYAVDTLNLGLAMVANALFSCGTTCDRLIDLLGVGTRTHAAPTI